MSFTGSQPSQSEPPGGALKGQPGASQGGISAWLRFLPGILLTLLSIWFLVKAVPLSSVLVEIRTIPAWSLLITVGIYLVSMVTRALCWQMLLQRKVSAWRAILALNEGYFLNNILPLRLGEIGRAVLLGQHSQLGMFRVLSTIVVERSYDMAIAASLLLLVLPQVLQMEWARPVATLMLVLIIVGLVALFLAARYRVWIEARLDVIANRLGLVRRFLPMVHSLLDGFSVLTRIEYFALSFGLLAFSWGVSILRDWVLLRQFVPDAPVWWAILAISASNLGGALPSAAASLGVFEAAAVSALTLVGFPPEAGLAYAVIIHTIHLISTFGFGFFALSQEGRSIGAIVNELRLAAARR